MFDRKGVIIVEREGAMEEDELMMIALDLGADDFSSEEDMFEILTSSENFSEIREALEKQGVILASAEIEMVPQNIVELDINRAPTFTKLIDMLEDDDDVQNVWHNAEFPEGYEG
jgi:transcriptional/translational regulatory protein YebC/TACO1